MLTDSWPLFGLSLRTERLVLRPPTDQDLTALADAIDAGVHDPALMPFSIAWTDEEPVARRRAALQHWWAARAAWTPERWNLHLAVLRDGALVGVQELHAQSWPLLREVGTGSWLTQSAQGDGVGKEMRAAVLDLGFHHLGAVRARTGAYRDNPASTGVTRALGYRENGSSYEAPRGTPAEMVAWILERDTWLARGEPQTQVTGLDPCLPMFGL